MNAVRNLIAAAALAAALAAQGNPGLGGSLLLPEFNPAQQSQRILDSLNRLAPIQEAIKTSKERIGPLVETYQKDPSIDHREALERELATLTQALAQNVERVVGERERIRFAMQDLNRLSITSEHAVEAASKSLVAKAKAESDALGQRREQLEQLARRIESASENERGAMLDEFKLAHREFRRIQLRQQVLQATAANHDNMLRGVRAVRRGFEAVSGNLNDVFARIEDAGSLLGFVAGVRKETADLLGQYQRLFGSGSDSLREALVTLGSIEGQLQLVTSLTDSLDAAGSFAGIIGQMEDFSRSLLPATEGHPTAAVTSDDYWLDQVRGVGSGEFFRPPAAKGAAAATKPKNLPIDNPMPKAAPASAPTPVPAPAPGITARREPAPTTPKTQED